MIKEFIKEYPIEKLKEWDRNPRKNDLAADKLTEMIGEYGFINPIIIDQNGTIRAGHTRLKAAKKMKLGHVPVIIYDFENEAQAIGYAIADNKLSEIAEWDFEMLGELMKELDDTDFDTSLTGFEESEMESFRERPEVEEDEVPEVPEEPITKRGDIWLLGKHKVMCGDSTDEADVLILMDGKKADMVFTDPPYGVDYDGGMQFTKNGVKTGQREKLKNDHTDDIYSAVVPVLAGICDGPCYVWFAGTKASKLYASVEVFGDIHALLIWIKNGGYGALNANYKQKHEPCLYWKPKGKKLNFVGATTETTIWDISKDGVNKLHPTQKPVALAEKAIKNHSVGLVSDLFLGSGSTLIACEKTNRTCYGMEIDEHYCDVIVQRYINFKGTDDDVFLLRNGETTKYSDL